MADDIEGKVAVTVLGNEKERMIAVTFGFSSDEEYETAMQKFCDQVDNGYIRIKFKPRGGNA